MLAPSSGHDIQQSVYLHSFDSTSAASPAKMVILKLSYICSAKDFSFYD